MTELCALASGSNGNAYYIGNETDAVLIDAGISFRRLNERLNAAGLTAQKIRAIIVSHEHSDHISGLRSCCKRLNIPAYLSEKMYYKAYRNHLPDFVNFYTPGVPVIIGSIDVHPFRKSHDASDPFSFRIACNGHQIGVMTDIGVADNELTEQFGHCHAVFLESNYDETMLWNGSYPDYIKRRVASNVGHLSNIQARDIVEKFAAPQLTHLVLSHISEHNNTPEIVAETFSALTDKYAISITSRSAASALIRL